MARIEIIFIGSPDHKFGHWIFTRNISRIKETGPASCQLIMNDGTKYMFNNEAIKVVNMIFDNHDDAEQEFLDMPPGTEVEQ